MNNIVIFGPTHSGKTTLLGYLSTGMYRNVQFNTEVYQRLKLIRSLSDRDDFNIGDPRNPIKLKKDVLLASFVSLDRDELRKFKGDEDSVGTSKRIHRRQLTICLTDSELVESNQNRNANADCTFIDMPGFRQRLSDKYRGFFEGNVGIAVIDINEVLRLKDLMSRELDSKEQDEKNRLTRRLFDPLRIWCDYRSPEKLIVVLSKVDTLYGKTPDGNIDPSMVEEITGSQLDRILAAQELIESNTESFRRSVKIPVVPIFIHINSEEAREHSRMKVFFTRIGENIYSSSQAMKQICPDTLITCLQKMMSAVSEPDQQRYVMANVYRIMRTKVNNQTRPVLLVHAVHGAINTKDAFTLGPVLYQKSTEPCYMECVASSIKADGAKEQSPALLEGNVGGVIMKSVKLLPDRKTDVKTDYLTVQKDIRILKSSILFSGQIVTGDIIRLRIRTDEHIIADEYGEEDEILNTVLPSIMPYDQLYLFWYGKRITVNVVEIIATEDCYQFSMIISKSERKAVGSFALPVDPDGELRYRSDQVLLAIPEGIYSHISDPKKIQVFTYISANIDAVLKSSDYVSYKLVDHTLFGIEMTLDGTKYVCLPETDDPTYLVELSEESKEKDIYSVSAHIKHGMKWAIPREYYRNRGGMELRLQKAPVEDGESAESVK